MTENIHSYEQRSSSELGHRLHSVKNRVIVVNRHDPTAAWSTHNKPVAKRRRKFGSNCNCFGDRVSNRRRPANLIRQSLTSQIEHYDFGPFHSNEWLTSKYTLLTFLPKNLFEQFRRLANFYFLTTAVLQIVIPYSPVGPMTSLLPLVFVVSTSAIKQAYEDYLRHKLDAEVNNRPCHVLRDKRLVKISTKDIKVGDFVYVKNNDEIPCDMVLLAASGPGDRCHITTANLDGESSLKSRTCFQIRDQLGRVDRLDDTLLVLECEAPNATLYEFNGYLRAPKSQRSYDKLISSLLVGSKSDSVNSRRAPSNQRKTSTTVIDANDSNEVIAFKILSRIKNSQNKILQAQTIIKSTVKQSQYDEQLNLDQDANNNADSQSGFHEIPLDITNLLLRASRLRNTSYIYGLAVYTGIDTKLAHNSQVKANKFSSTESRVNLFLILAFIALLSFSLIGAFMYKSPDYWFLKKLEKTESFGQIFVAHFLIYNYLVPISLYVTLEFIKFFGTISVVEDKKMKVAVWHSISNVQSKDSALELAQPIKVIPNEAGRNQDDNFDSKRKTVDNLMSVPSTRRIKVIEGPKCNSSDLNEDLGQVEVLFSDKTGTLTENKMRFMACSIYGKLFRAVGEQLFLQPAELYGAPIDGAAVQRLAQVNAGRHMLLNPSAKSLSQSNSNIRRHKSQQRRFSDRAQEKPFDHRVVPPMDKLQKLGRWDQEERVAEFFICLCLCSTISLNEQIPIEDCLPDRTGNEFDFQSASPDEESLISTAHLYGITMCKSNDQECYITIEKSRIKKQTTSDSDTKQKRGKFRPLAEGQCSNDRYIVRHFKRLLVLEFNSVRKRMSVIYKDCDSDCLLMVTKGSEELLDCVSLSQLDQQTEHNINATLSHFEAFALSGLRTLLVARRVLSNFDYEQIEAGMKEARSSIQNREHLLSRLYSRAESDLRLIGATAVEDTLQEWVPETIAGLKEAGIKVWLLTGDKVETAISVAYLCKLLERDMYLFHLVRQQDVQACQKLLGKFEKQLKALKEGRGFSASCFSNSRSKKTLKSATKSSHQSKSTSPKSSDEGLQTVDQPRETLMDETFMKDKRVDKFAMIADGRSLYYAMKYARKELASLCQQCTCVLGCRLSPLQKAEVVYMIKKGDSMPVTAAIGDGANDVSMIQEAHVGIGVSGKEGRQAVNSSDFAISRFHMLNRLLFVHGHLFYHRTVNTIHYFFYKNILFIIPQFLYSFYNLSSAQSLYHPLMLVCYNLVFTSMPILLYGLGEVHIPESLLEQYPKLYRLNRGNKQMQLSVFFKWLLLGTLQAMIGFFLLYLNFGSHTPILESGKMMGSNGFALILYFVIILTATMKLYFLSKNHSFSFNLSAGLSCLMLVIVFYVYSLIDWSFIVDDNSLYGQLQSYILSPMFWVAVSTTTAATLVPDIIWYVKERITYFKQINSLIVYYAK